MSPPTVISFFIFVIEREIGSFFFFFFVLQKNVVCVIFFLKKIETVVKNAPKHPQKPAPGNGLRARALFDFEGSTTSELTFKAGDEISRVVCLDGEWWRGRFNGKLGHFPKVIVFFHCVYFLKNKIDCTVFCFACFWLLCLFFRLIFY